MVAHITIRRSAAGAALGLGILLATCAATAGSLDRDSTDALGATLDSLQGRATPSPTGEAPGIPGADPRLKSLADSPELTREFYDLSVQIFTEVAEKSGGDIDKMNAAIARAKSDPAGFAASLSPRTRERLRALSAKIPANAH